MSEIPRGDEREDWQGLDDDGDYEEEQDARAEYICVSCLERAAIINGLCAACSELCPDMI